MDICRGTKENGNGTGEMHHAELAFVFLMSIHYEKLLYFVLFGGKKKERIEVEI